MGEFRRIPVELGESLLAREPVGHAGDVGHRGPEGVGAAGREVVDVDIDRGASGGQRDGVWPVGVVLDEGPQQRDHGVSLGAARRPQVHVLVVEAPEDRQRLGVVGVHPDAARGHRGGDHRPDERAELARPVAPAPFGDDRGKHLGAQDAGGDGVLEVVTDVGDPVGPRHDLTLRCLRRRQAPRMVTDPVERLAAQVERLQRDVGAPRGMVEPAVEVGRQGVLAGVPARSVPAVVPDGDRLGEWRVESQCLGDRSGHLGDLERVGHAGALVIVGEHEHLGLAGEPPERRIVQDAIAIALEARPERVGLLGDRSVPGSAGSGGSRGE